MSYSGYGYDAERRPPATTPWVACSSRLPERGVVVDARIDDEHGVRNEQPLKRGSGTLWLHPDGGMYVYYEPTHWRERLR